MPAYITHSEKETEALAREFAGNLRAGDVIAFRGGLGAGKTAFTRGLAQGLGVSDEVSSPTFAIANFYRGGKMNLAHFDMYRISGMEALEGTGYYDYMTDCAPVVYAVEWSEHIEGALPDDTIFITIEPQGETARRIVIEGGIV